MNKLTIGLIVLSFLSFVRCDSAKSGSSAGSKSRYGLKQACVEYQITGDMFSGTETLYFDRYGMREAKYSQQTVNVMGMKQENHTATFINFDEDGIIYTYDYKTKSGTKMENPLKEAFQKKDMKEVGKEMMVQMGGQKIGTGKVLGKTCEIWEIKKMGTKTWVWNWINLKTETNMMGMKMTIEAKKISETFDKKKLQRPNVKYRDMSEAMKRFQGLDALKKKYQKN
ncbi:MAG: hypothetical protein ACE5HO_04235 [bacterium]